MWNEQKINQFINYILLVDYIKSNRDTLYRDLAFNLTTDLC